MGFLKNSNNDRLQCLKVVCVVMISWLNTLSAYSQFNFGNSGLMQMPTADMQKSSTFMAGAGWLDKSALPQSSGYGWKDFPTLNYYVNMTVFPWLELNYSCTLIRGTKGSGKVFNNQDRHFDARFRLWKEGWGRSWTPQIVAGFNDLPGLLGSIKHMKSTSNEFWKRAYVAATKHFSIDGAGTIGAHVAYNYVGGKYLKYKGASVGTDFLLDKLHTGSASADRWLTGLGVMAEYYDHSFNAGLRYGIPMHHRKDGSEIWSVNFITGLNRMKNFSGGICFKVHLKD